MKQTPLSSPGLTGRPSIPETFEIDREAAAYSIARSSRATTVLIVAAALPSPSFFLGALATKQSILSLLCQNGLLRGACHRARIRATRWLAMTLIIVRSPLPRSERRRAEQGFLRRGLRAPV